MSEQTSPDLDDVPARLVALDAAIRVAIEKSQESSRWYRRFSTSDVESELQADVSSRTVRRALQNAHALGWVTRPRPRAKYQPGDRAEQFQPTEEAQAADVQTYEY